jgi:hypothetical protein
MNGDFLLAKIVVNLRILRAHRTVIAAVRRVLADDPYPRAPRLAPLRRALAKLEPLIAASVVTGTRAASRSADTQQGWPKGEAFAGLVGMNAAAGRHSANPLPA